MKKIAIFASGNGSNYEALVTAFSDDEEAVISLLVCDKPQAYVLERAKKWGTPFFAISIKDFESKAHFEQAILEQLHKHRIDLIVLAGYMRLFGPTLLKAYMGRIVNIHPSLLPAFAGKDAVGQAFSYGVRVTGITIHFVDEGMDTGAIIFQAATEIAPLDTLEQVTAKIQALEYQHYPRVIKQLVQGAYQLKEGKVKWAQPLNEH
jgi:phosphoribosylglycinamide formyltransferase-1